MKVKFKNLKYLEQYEYDSEVKSSVFIGENGSGKSLLIKHIRFISMLIHKNLGILNLSNSELLRNNEKISDLKVDDILCIDNSELFGYEFKNAFILIDVQFYRDVERGIIRLREVRLSYEGNSICVMRFDCDDERRSRKIKRLRSILNEQKADLEKEKKEYTKNYDSKENVDDLILSNGEEILANNDLYNRWKSFNIWDDSMRKDSVVFVDLHFSARGYIVLYLLMQKWLDNEDKNIELVEPEMSNDKLITAQLVYNDRSEIAKITLASLVNDMMNLIDSHMQEREEVLEFVGELMLTEEEDAFGKYVYRAGNVVNFDEFFQFEPNKGLDSVELCKLKVLDESFIDPVWEIQNMREEFINRFSLFDTSQFGGMKYEISRDFEHIKSSIITRGNPLFELFEIYKKDASRIDRNLKFNERISKLCSLEKLCVESIDEEFDSLKVYGLRDGEKIVLSNLSTGEIHCLIVILSMSVMTGGIYLHEVDVFLHPNKLSEFVRVIFEILDEELGNVRELIVETHSPILIRELQLMRVENQKYKRVIDETRIFYRAKEGSVNRIIEIKENGDLSEEIPSGFSDHLARLNMLRLQFLD